MPFFLLAAIFVLVVGQAVVAAVSAFSGPSAKLVENVAKCEHLIIVVHFLELQINSLSFLQFMLRLARRVLLLGMRVRSLNELSESQKWMEIRDSTGSKKQKSTKKGRNANGRNQRVKKTFFARPTTSCQVSIQISTISPYAAELGTENRH